MGGAGVTVWPNENPMALPEILGAKLLALKDLPLKAKAGGAVSAMAVGGAGLNKDRVAGRAERLLGENAITSEGGAGVSARSGILGGAAKTALAGIRLVLAGTDWADRPAETIRTKIVPRAIIAFFRFMVVLLFSASSSQISEFRGFHV